MKIYQATALALLLATPAAHAEKFSMKCTPEAGIPYTVNYDSGSRQAEIVGGRTGFVRIYRAFDVQDNPANHVLYVATKAKGQTRTVYLAIDHSGLNSDVSSVRVKDIDGNDNRDKCANLAFAAQPKLPELHTTMPSKNWEPPATTPANRDPWTALVEDVIKISSRQNGGTPDHIHFCEPKFKRCADALYYKDVNRRDTMLIVHKDIAGNVIFRAVCKFNETGDIRTCIDFDTKGQSTDMKDVNGDWNNIDN